MTDTPDIPPVLRGPGIPVRPIDWRTSGFVAVHRSRWPTSDLTAHRAVKWYDDQPVTKVSGNWAASDLIIRPACMDPDPNAGYIEVTPLYAASRGAVWCRDPRCFAEADDDA